MFYDDDRFDDQDNRQSEDENKEQNEDINEEDKKTENEDTVDNTEDNSRNNDEDVDEYNRLENRYDGWQSTEEYYEQQRRERGEYTEKEEKKKDPSVTKKTIGWLVALCIMVSLIAGIGASAILSTVNNNSKSTSTTSRIETTAAQGVIETSGTESTSTSKEEQTVTTGATLVDITTTPDEGDSLTPSKIFKKVSSSVVCIRITTSTGSGAGSGVVISKDGYIITNYHVANETCTSINVIFYDNTEYSATYVFGDEVADVAMIKIEKEDCVPVEIADSNKVEMGDGVVVIGNALGNGITITSGIVSNVNGTFVLDDIATKVIQVDAAINQGNSGGGLFNEQGQLIGIVNAKTGGTLVDGVGYAIPSNKVISAIKDLQTYGYVTGRAKFGLVSSRADTTSTEYYLYAYYGLFQVSTITEGGSCDGTDVRKGDILYKINGQNITYTSLKAILAKYSFGDTVTLTVLRPTADISNYETKFGSRVTYDFASYLEDCEQVDIEITFVEFN